MITRYRFNYTFLCHLFHGMNYSILKLLQIKDIKTSLDQRHFKAHLRALMKKKESHQCLILNISCFHYSVTWVKCTWLPRQMWNIDLFPSGMLQEAYCKVKISTPDYQLAHVTTIICKGHLRFTDLLNPVVCIFTQETI